MAMRLPRWFKRTVLSVVERAGYAVVTQQELAHLRDTVTALQHAVAAPGTAVDYQVLTDYVAKLRKFEHTDPEFFALYERVKPYTMTSIERLYAMHKAVEHVARAGLQGAIVECGVWRGGSMMMAALTLAALGKTDRDLFLFDTFAGHPRPNPERDLKEHYEFWLQRRRTDQSSSWAEVTLEEVRDNLSSTGYPLDRVHLTKGIVQETIPAAAPEKIALLRLDTDWYDSTAHEMRHLYPRLVPGGVLILDDYGEMPGQKQAVDEFCERNELFLLLNRIDPSGRIAVKFVDAQSRIPQVVAEVEVGASRL
jgi:O-methyltransferase